MVVLGQQISPLFHGCETLQAKSYLKQNPNITTYLTIILNTNTSTNLIHNCQQQFYNKKNPEGRSINRIARKGNRG
ncbi:hypothetical protein C1H46_027499 [Malus baccata]|uniref:Uncharacterized protein n=1 Tax=Malus baccata TaxID=106549 RepID=A0A540LKT4_MALBA|nr:hypothetical protein C1H46_027499 [Malus baccata]